MTRTLYGAAPGDVVTVVASDPTTADASHRDLSPLAGTLQVWSYDRTVQETDLLAADPVTLAAGAAITVVTADATTGRTAFYGKDSYAGAYYGKDSNGKWWLFNPPITTQPGGGTGTVTISDNGDGTAVITF